MMHYAYMLFSCIFYVSLFMWLFYMGNFRQELGCFCKPDILIFLHIV